MGQYEVCTRPEPLEEAIAERGADGTHFGEIEALEPLEAFGGAGAYNRFAVARLYGGIRVRVVRGWRVSADRFESVTLLSPYPDAAFRHLNPGTMTITLTLRLLGAITQGGAGRFAPRCWPLRSTVLGAIAGECLEPATATCWRAVAVGCAKHRGAPG